MAISRGPAARALDYLGSTRSIVGSGAAIAGLVATVPTDLAGPLWPAVVAGMYGIGALLAPPDKASFGTGGEVDPRAQAVELQRHLDRLTGQVHRYGRRLPDDVLGRYAQIEEALRELLSQAEQLATSSDHLFVVGKIITSYLPTSLETYANLPRSFAMRHSENERNAHDELLHHLGLIEREIEGIREAVFSGDATKLKAQGRFLEDRFRRSELDLP